MKWLVRARAGNRIDGVVGTSASAIECSTPEEAVAAKNRLAAKHPSAVIEIVDAPR